MSDPGVSAGEVGGVFAGAVAGLVALGKGVGWLLNFRERQAERRSVKLQLWHDEVEAREKAIEAKEKAHWARIENEFTLVKNQNMALRMAFELVAAPLRALDPHNPALSQAEQLLRAAFPLEITPTFDPLLAQLDTVTSG